MRFRQWERPRLPFWRVKPASKATLVRGARRQAEVCARHRDRGCLVPACRIAIFNLLNEPSHADFKKFVKIAGAYCDSKEEQAPTTESAPHAGLRIESCGSVN